MEFEFKDLDSIYIEEGYVVPAEDTHELICRTVISTDGSIAKYDYKEDVEYSLRTDKEKVEKLFDDICNFIPKVCDVPITFGGTGKNLTFYFKNWVSVDIPLKGIDEEGNLIGDIVDKFLDQCIIEEEGH